MVRGTCQRVPVASSLPCWRGCKVPPEEGGRGRPGLGPALQQGRVEVAELCLQRAEGTGLAAGTRPAPCDPSLQSISASWARASDSGAAMAPGSERGRGPGVA